MWFNFIIVVLQRQNLVTSSLQAIRQDVHDTVHGDLLGACAAEKWRPHGRMMDESKAASSILGRIALGEARGANYIAHLRFHARNEAAEALRG